MNKISQQPTMKNRRFDKLKYTYELQMKKKEYSLVLDLLIILYYRAFDY